METQIGYLARTKTLEHEKAFSIDFPVGHIPGARQTNHETDSRTVTIHHVEDPRQWSLEEHGFCILKAPTSFPLDQLAEKKEQFQRRYWYELEALLHRHFPQYSRIESYDCTVRKRDPDFPAVKRGYGAYEPPSTSPHADLSRAGSLLELSHCFPGQEAAWKGKDFDMLNVWRPLVGPCDDWPLAVCDWKSIDAEKDICLNDAIRRDRIGEGSQLHYNPNHKWYWVRDQQVDDLIVFRNADSQGKRSRCFHCAVYNAKAKNGPRQSIEVRMVAFY